MANPDRPRGFTPVKHRNGGSWNNALAERAMVDATEFAVPTATWKIGIGTPVIATDEAAAATSGPLANLRSVKPMVDEDVTGGAVGVYGVVVGIGRPAGGDTLNQEVGPYDPQNLDDNGPVTDAEITADPDGTVLWIAPARDWIFSVQNDGAQTIQVGDVFDINMADDEAEQVNALTGRSIVELTGAAGGENCRVVEVFEKLDNVTNDANAELLVMFVDPWGAAAESQ